MHPREELSSLISAFCEHARRQKRHGALWIGKSPSPRRLSDDEPLELTEERAEPADERVEPTEAQRVEAQRVEAQRVERPVAQREAEPASREQQLAGVRTTLGDCKRCRLSEVRRNLVFGVGSPNADLMLVGEAPGREEDLQGEPFVGAAGQLLTKMLGAMGLSRDDVYICNILKCRPPQNRDPEPDEVETCEPFLRMQIDAIGPRIIIALGNFAAKTLLRTTTGITHLRGSFREYHGIPLMPTFHPAYLLRNEAGKRPAWQDLKAVMREMDRLGLERRR
jgi:uracil-DNA glycosylase family 4